MNSTWQFTVFGFILPATLFGLHQLGLWMQRRGWIEYTRPENNRPRRSPPA
ncbi:MAG TPA: hypothetical protein VLT57_20060 [Bryobacteraceae bacterium]|nr:hypothetical protein [Bryobacteraceae bacterium]